MLELQRNISLEQRQIMELEREMGREMHQTKMELERERSEFEIAKCASDVMTQKNKLG